MMTLIRSWSLRFVAATLVLATIPVSAEDAEGVVRLGQSPSTGVVRISDNVTSELTVRGQSQLVEETGEQAECRTCNTGYVEGDLATYGGYHYGPFIGSNTKFGQWLSWNIQSCSWRKHQACQTFRASCKADLYEKKQFLRCKFGYFIPTGADGKGVPPYGHYNMVYPVNPAHFDQRDGQVYAAAGHGGPVSVPIAPVVNHTYNYGWGIPSSRLTPIAHPLTPGVPTP